MGLEQCAKWNKKDFLRFSKLNLYKKRNHNPEESTIKKTQGGCSGVHLQSSYLEPEFTDRCELEPAWDPHGRRFLRGSLIERSEVRSLNGSFTYNQDLERNKH